MVLYDGVPLGNAAGVRTAAVSSASISGCPVSCYVRA
uniref:Uncharacterized protein n=1 Tax=Arundo donax TaxID=35708 RepID=A0A0A9G7T8_ARUDO